MTLESQSRDSEADDSAERAVHSIVAVEIADVPREQHRGGDPGACVITSRASCGRSSERRPDVESAAQAGFPVACIAARHVSMPSPTMTSSLGSPRRTTPPRQLPSIIFMGSTGAFPLPSRARKCA